MSSQRPTTTEEWEAWCAEQATLLVCTHPWIGWRLWLQLKWDELVFLFRVMSGTLQ